ncbi:hypothetical protein [Micromonospora sp. NPDC002717]|uniref:hypothetical protein n=1 Tax=Micromonospora sp. NPDC002717 TaxID=3154424 RepID=UPI00331705DA
MTTTEEQGAAGGVTVREVVRDVVASVAQEELPLVDGLFAFDDATVVRRLGARGGRREPLGFGWGEVVALATPVVWLVVQQLADRAAASAVDGAAKGTRAMLRKVFRRRAAPVEVPALTREQLGEVRQRVLEVAVQRGLDDERATAIADALVTRLALTAPVTPVPEPVSPDRPGPGDRA